VKDVVLHGANGEGGHEMSSVFQAGKTEPSREQGADRWGVYSDGTGKIKSEYIREKDKTACTKKAIAGKRETVSTARILVEGNKKKR
jgi:hypothetical protein